MTFDIKSIDIAGNSIIGLFGFATDRYAILPFSTKKKVNEICKEVLKVEPINATLVNSKLIGLFATGTDDTFIVPDVITFDELDFLKKNLPDTKIEVIHSKITALGNTITISEKIALVHPEFERDARKKIEDALDKGEGKIEAFCNDGEGYYVIVKYDNSGWLNGDWARRAVPYTDEVAREKRENALWPWQPKELQKRGKS